jgi:pimeloyl-ACP methyl ester carboxylesterase
VIELSDYEVGGIHVWRAEPERRTHTAPVLFVHGGYHGAWCWENFLPYFASRGWQCHALSWRGHGRSAPLPEQEAVRRPLEDVATDIDVVAATLDCPPVLVAHSMGALSALKYVERNEHSGLVLLTPALPREAPPAPVDVPFDLAVMSDPPPFEVTWQRFFSGTDEADARRYHSMMVPESPKAIEQVVTDNLVSIDPAKISGPVLVVAGELDVLSQAPGVRRLAGVLGADYYYAHGFGHGVMMDRNWERVARVVQAWLGAHAIEVAGEYAGSAS